MLEEKDLQALASLIDSKLDEKLKTINESIRDLNLEMENTVKPQLQALAEGQKTILETLAPKNRVEALEDEVAFLKQMIRTLASDVNNLKKAQ